jgi:hypothetical protein
LIDQPGPSLPRTRENVEGSNFGFQFGYSVAVSGDTAVVEICRMNADGSAQTRLTAILAFDGEPSYL